MGPVIPPSIYPTHFPLPPPPDLEYPANLDRNNFKKANNIVTSNLEDLETQDALPYGPVQFWTLLYRYYTIANSRFESLSEILQRRNYKPFRLINLDRSSDRVQIADLLHGITQHLSSVSRLIEKIQNEVQPIVGAQAPGTYDLSSSVPNVSLRECRLWCMLNTKAFHQKLQEAKGDKAKLAPIMEDVAAIICARSVIKDNIPVVKLRNSANIVTPYMIFICLGQTENGDRVHDLVHVGCTREWMTQWEDLFQLRDHARNSRLGEATIKAWRDWYHRLVALDTEASADGKNDGECRTAISNVRTALLNGDENALPESGKRLLAEQLRACNTHQGQAFRQLEWFQVKPTPCCYMCKTSMDWKEVSNPDVARSVKLELGKRQNCPHSCAEVATSGYCDYITRQGM